MVQTHNNDSIPPSQGPAKAFQQVLKHRSLFLAVFGVSFVLIAAVVFILPKKYESEMKLLVNTERPDMVITPTDTRNGATPTELPEVRINSEIEILKSDDVLQKVLDAAGLVDTAAAAKSGTPLAEARNGALVKLTNRLKIEPVKKSEIISVTYRAKTPEMAQKVLNALSTNYLELHLKSHATPGSFKFFDDEANLYARKLAHSEDEMRDFRELHPSTSQTTDTPDPLVQRAMDAQAALDDASAQESDYRKRVEEGHAQIADLSERVTAQISTMPQAALTSQLQGSISELQNRRTEMATKFNADDRMVTQLDQEIAQTTALLNAAKTQNNVQQVTDVNQVRAESEKTYLAAKSTLAGMTARRAQLASIARSYKTQLSDNAGAGIESDRLTRQIKEDEENYLLYSKKREESRISDALDQQRITDVALVEAPTMSVEPASPVIPIDLAVGFLLACLCGYLGVLARIRFEPSLETSQEAGFAGEFALPRS